MTSPARIILQDLKKAISLHTESLQSEEFRISWVAVVTLSRAIGHVLSKTDSTQSEELRRAIEEKWNELKRTKPEPKIFWELIDKERNRFLKEYTHTVSRTLTIPTINDTVIVADLGNSRGGSLSSPNGNYESIINSGEFRGRTEVELAGEAYDWWESYLNDVDDLANTYTNT